MGVEDEQVPVVAPEVAAPPAEVPAASSTPWRRELDEYFADQPEDFRAKVDSYVREKRQPYVTKLEQERADLEERAAWYDDLEADPDAVLRDAIEQKYSPDVAAKFVALLEEGAPAEEAVAALPAATLAPEDRAVLDYAKEQQAERELATYLAEVDEVLKDKPHVNKDSFHFYVEKAGDLADALELYNKHYPPPVVDAPPPPTPPATLSGGGAAAPMAQTPLSLDQLGSALFDAARGTQ